MLGLERLCPSSVLCAKGRGVGGSIPPAHRPRGSHEAMRGILSPLALCPHSPLLASSVRLSDLPTAPHSRSLPPPHQRLCAPPPPPLPVASPESLSPTGAQETLSWDSQSWRGSWE